MPGSLPRRGRVRILILVAITLCGAAGAGASVAVSQASTDCGTTFTAAAAADSWVDQSSPTNNYGSDAILKIRSKDSGGNYRALVRLPLPDLPAGCLVESATLRLYAPSADTGSSLDAVRLAAGWTESQVTWLNLPSTVGPAATVFAEDGYMEWRVAAQVQAMYDEGANHGFLIRDAAESGDGAEQSIHSREKGENPPQLVLRFRPADLPPDEAPRAPAPAAVTCGQLLTRSTLVLNDLFECPGDGLVIGAARIIVDLDGHTIDGVGLGAGIRNTGFDSVTIRNGTVQEFDHGVRLQAETGDNVVEGLNVQLNQLAGIELTAAGDGNQLRMNTLTGNHHAIALLLGTRETTVVDNTVSASGGTGLVIQDSGGNLLERNSVSRGGDLGIGLVRASGNTLIGNTVSANSDGGIDLVEGSHGNRVEDNTVTQSGDAGILIAESDRNVLVANRSHEMSDAGISLSGANDSVIQGNDVRFNPGGLQLDGSSRNLLQFNNASDSTGIGIELGDGSFANNVIENTANANGAQGIYLAGEATEELGNTVVRNSASGNLSDGIATGKGGHTILDNIARDNGGWGINAALGTIDRGGNVANGNVNPAQCIGVVCHRVGIDVMITGVDQDGKPVRGHCARLTAPGLFKQACDAADGTTDGVIRLADVPPGGGYTLSQPYTPNGFAPPSPNALPVVVGAASTAFTLTSHRTDLAVTLVDQNGKPVIGACFTAAAGNYNRTLCDKAAASDGLDGVTLITYAPAGAVTLTQSTVPLGWASIPQQSTTVVAGTLATLTLTTTPLVADLVVTGIDQHGTPVRGACSRLVRTGYFKQACDSSDGSADGVVRFAAVPLASFTLSQPYTPIGFLGPEPVVVDVRAAGGPQAATLSSRRTDLRVTLVDDLGSPVTGACFRVTQGSYARTLCDGRAVSGGLNGTTLIDYAPTGQVTLTQTTTPAGFVAMASQTLTLSGGVVTDFAVTTRREAAGSGASVPPEAPSPTPTATAPPEPTATRTPTATPVPAPTDIPAPEPTSTPLPAPTPIPDTDGDGLLDPDEEAIGTDPALADSDGDGLADGAEVAAGTDPLDGFGPPPPPQPEPTVVPADEAPTGP